MAANVKPQFFTTAGTQYNPDHAAPLRPPARRPRRLRGMFADGDEAFDSTADLLFHLPLHDAISSPPPTTASSLHQYSPLQQNYDRAVNPILVSDQSAPTTSSMAAPTLRSGNQPPSAVGLASALPPAGKQHGSVAATDAESVESFDTNESFPPLSQLTQQFSVKGLTNLASYANPVQKACQMALALGRAPNTTNPSRPSTPSSLAYTASGQAKSRMPGAAGFNQLPPGAPQPLMAGPPGNRQTKMSRAGSFPAPGPDRQPRYENGQMSLGQLRFLQSDPRSAPLFSANKSTVTPHYDVSVSPAARAPTWAALPMTPIRKTWPATHNSSASTSISISVASTPDMEGAANASKGDMVETLSQAEASAYYPNGFPPNYPGTYKSVVGSRKNTSPTTGDRVVHAGHQDMTTPRMGTHERFYSGRVWLSKALDGVSDEIESDRLLDAVNGLLGKEEEEEEEENEQDMAGNDDIRDSSLFHLPQPLEMADATTVTEVEHPLSITDATRMAKPDHPLSVADAMAMTEAEHAEPLILLALGTLLKYKEAGKSGADTWSRGFAEADAAWIDSTEEGNKSFFDKPKKRRAVRKTRRGY